MIKHSKYRNTGILFELLVRQTTSDLINNQDSKAVKILKKYFHNTELGKEYVLYNTFSTVEPMSESKAEIVISTVIDQYKKLDHEKVKKLKYNLIKEIKSTYDIEEFFKAKIDNYKKYGSIFTIFESQNSKSVDAKQIIINKINLLECLTKQSSDNKKIPDSIMEEFLKQDKEVRLLAYKVLVNKFNDKYQNLTETQKDVLKKYINSVSDTKSLVEYLNEQVATIKKEIKTIKKSIDDKVLVIKLNEIESLIKPLDESKAIKDETVVGILQCFDLINEIKKKNEQ